MIDNKFQKYQENKMTARLDIIKKYVELYKKNKTSFKSITELAAKLSASIAKEEGKPCSTSTLLRNAQYKVIMEDFLNRTSKKTNTAKNLLVELVQSNAERENTRLKNYIQHLEKQLEVHKGQNTPMEEKKQLTYLTPTEAEVAHLKKSLALLLEHFEGLVAIEENGDIVDLTKKSNNVIVKSFK